MEMDCTPTLGAAASRRLHLWLLSPYHTGSHRAWAEGYRQTSRHRVTLLTMAGRFWKWRMQGGAVELAAQAKALLAAGEMPDAVLATDMVHLPAWLGLLREGLPGRTPVLCYMHENQLTYPWRPGEKPDLTYGMINWLSQVAADAVLFNSRYHQESWFDELPRLLKHFPDYNHLELVAAVCTRRVRGGEGALGGSSGPLGLSSLTSGLCRSAPSGRPGDQRGRSRVLWH
jgi:hypothetical protein